MEQRGLATCEQAGSCFASETGMELHVVWGMHLSPYPYVCNLLLAATRGAIVS